VAAHRRIQSIFSSMHTRCENRSRRCFPNYGGKGVRVCAEWSRVGAFEAWAIANGYRDDLVLDRIDPNGDYCPANCRWVTRQVSNENRSNVHWITAFGETKTVKAWARDPRCAVKELCLVRRVFVQQIPVEIAMSVPGSEYHRLNAEYPAIKIAQGKTITRPEHKPCICGAYDHKNGACLKTVA